MILAIVVGWAMSQNISSRLTHVAGVAQRVSSGDLAGRVQVTGGDEITQVAQSLNEMADTLAARIAEAKALAEDNATERQKLAELANEAWEPAAELGLLLGDPVFWGWGVPRGDGRPVLVVPGE